MQNVGAILILSGPSGCGKSTLLKYIYQNISNYYFSISTTTRSPREGEKDGVDYFFVSKEEFEKDIEAGNFLEYAKVHDNYYGTSLKPIKDALSKGKLVIFDIDVQGHDIVREKLNDIVTSVFITTASLKVLENRLTSRNSDSLDVIQKRLINAKSEINSFDKYDFLIINDDLQKASQEILAVANVALLKAKLFNKNELIANWLSH